MASENTKPVPASLADHRVLTTADLPAIAEYLKPAAKKTATAAKKGAKKS